MLLLRAGPPADSVAFAAGSHPAPVSIAGPRTANGLLPARSGRNFVRPKRYSGLRSKRFKFSRYDKTGERELYDLRKDPFELDNLLVDGKRRWERRADDLERHMKRVARTPSEVR